MPEKKILIIDDDIDLVEAMRLTLESAGFNVMDAQEGQKGLEKVKNENPDLILLDVMMPQMNGLDALKILVDKKFLVIIIRFY